MLELAILIVLTIFCIQLFFRKQARLCHFKKLPGLRPQFLIGNIAWVLKLYAKAGKYHPGVYIIERVLGTNILFQKYGFHCFWFGPNPVISIFSPELLEIVLSSNVSLEKSFEYRFLERWLGRGLLTSTGPKWRARRKLLTPSFHFKILEDFLPTFNDQSLILVKKLQSLQHEDYVDIQPPVILCTLDIVCETVMGAQIGAQKGENIEYVTAIHNLAGFFNQRTIRPWLWYDALFSLTSSGRGFDRDLKILHGFTEKVIREKKQERLSQNTSPQNEEKENEFQSKKRKAFMDLLLDLHLDGQQLSEQDIQEEVDTFMFEGHDTTAMGIIFALYSIGLNPKIQERVHEELDTVFGNDLERHVTMDDVRNMKYLECVLKESQRLFPSVPIIGRKLNEDINYNGMFIPRDTELHCNIISVHRRDDIYPNPEVFDPERFQPENSLDRHPYAFIPFSAGPRNCIGQKFALLEEKVVVSNILRHFKVISLDPRDKFHMKVEFTLRPAQPVRLKFISRR
ncbi:cytochrome P450 4C1-like [Argiope bruennichi]|uniref:cytochrome P450 4C1-like n=1 Tax=Argiope bruennichi TaxID=94029 RepID=UPI002493F6F2|nr:cytochrome P450 4C1-like [Argiope bruennichi]